MKVEIKDTQTIQQQSVDAYMVELGYKRTKDGKRYEFMYPVKTGERFVSMQRAIELHNSKWMYDEVTKLYYPMQTVNRIGGVVVGKPNIDSVFKLSPYEYEKSQSRKIVFRVSLQQDKHGRMKVQSHLVNFYCNFYYEQFLGD